jgi:hypothetical protein
LSGLSFSINRGGVNRGAKALVSGGPTSLAVVAILAGALPVPTLRYTLAVQTIYGVRVPVPLFYDPTLFDVDYTACRDPTYTMTPTRGDAV